MRSAGAKMAPALNAMVQQRNLENMPQLEMLMLQEHGQGSTLRSTLLILNSTTMTFNTTADRTNSTNININTNTLASAVSMKVQKQQVALLLAGLWLARNERRDPYSSPYRTQYSSFYFLSHSFIFILNPKPYITPIIL